MEHLLFLVHRIPYPPNKGDKIRSFHLLQFLSGHYRVHLGTFVDRPEDWAYRAATSAFCATSWFSRLSPRWARVRSVLGLMSGAPLTLPYYRDRALARWVATTWATHAPRRILVFSAAMAQYVIDPRFASARRVCDFVDVDSDKWRQYSVTQPFPASWIYRREAKRLARFEGAVAERFDASLLVSEPEAALFRRQVPTAAARIFALRNGVDLAYFSPDPARPSPFAAEEQALVFTGAMDYWANAEGAIWFVREVLPKVRAAQPRARLYLVGMNPCPAVRRLAAWPGVTVTGSVPDVRPYLQHAAVAVVPLRIARGIQNKILEAMALARPVVTTPQALEGIPAHSGDALWVAREADEFAARIIALLATPDPLLGRRARAFVAREFDWARSLPALLDLLESRC